MIMPGDYDKSNMTSHFMSVDLFKRVPVTSHNSFDDRLETDKQIADDAINRHYS
jgi:hypothetical protein